MGVNIDENDFDTFDLLKNLEKARDDLYKKQSVTSDIPQTESVEVSNPVNSILALEWMQEESSETDDFILVESRKKREKRKSIVISPIGKGKAQDQENPGLAKKEEGSLRLSLPKTRTI